MWTLHRTIYALFALGMLGIGGIGALLPFGVLPEIAAGFDGEALHVVQEASAGALALGALSGWCACAPARCGAAHVVLTFYFALIAAIHWIDYVRDLRPLSSGLLTSVPFVVFVVLGMLRRGRGAASV